MIFYIRNNVKLNFYKILFKKYGGLIEKRFQNM
jgi:hypothetical protein